MSPESCYQLRGLPLPSSATRQQACFISLIMFSGGSQFALVGVLAAGAVAVAAVIVVAALFAVRVPFIVVVIAAALVAAAIRALT